MVKAIYFFCHYYILWESNNGGEGRGQSWNESLKSRWIPGGPCGYTSGTKRKHFATLSSPRPCWRRMQLQPSCGSPQWIPCIDWCGDKFQMFVTAYLSRLPWIFPGVPLIINNGAPGKLTVLCVNQTHCITIMPENWFSTITVTSRMRHGASNHRQLNMKHYWSFVTGIERWPKDQ